MRPKKFQSTRPQGARRIEVRVPTYIRLVSIHAPAGGATHSGVSRIPATAVSIHAPAGGATATQTSSCIANN